MNIILSTGILSNS